MEPQPLRIQRLSFADLDRLLGGDLSPEARALVEDWLKDPQAAENELDALGWALDASFHIRARSREDLLRRASEVLERRVGDRELHERESVQSERPTLKGWAVGRLGRQMQRQWSWSLTGGFALGVLLTMAVWNTGVHYINRWTGASTLAYTTYTTGNGQRANFMLPDGSKVALNVASRLDVPLDYGSGNRTVHLVGEGLFTVAHHDRAPFTVITGFTTTRVLGTSFAVRHYQTDTTTSVAVRDGKVAVHAMVLTEAQEMVIDRAGTARVQVADAARFSFATGVLTLTRMPLPQAVTELDRWYDADIRLGDTALKTQRLTGEYAAGSLADLADILELTFNVRVERDGRVLTLFPR